MDLVEAWGLSSLAVSDTGKRWLAAQLEEQQRDYKRELLYGSNYSQIEQRARVRAFGTEIRQQVVDAFGIEEN